jgi:hypothetical protein
MATKDKKIHEFGQRFVELTEEVRKYFLTDWRGAIATHDEFALILRHAAFDYGRDAERWSVEEEEERFQQGAYGNGPFASKVKRAKKSKSAAAGRN